MKLGSVPLRPLWPGSMPTVIPASGSAAFGVGLAFGVGVAVAGSDARTAAGEAAASPAAPVRVPLAGGCGLPHATASRQTRTAGHAAATSTRGAMAVTVWLGLLGADQLPNVSMFSIFHRPPSRRAVTANIAPA